MKKIYILLTGICPVCNKSSMYQYSIFRLDKILKIKESCDVCNTNYIPEPGFYLGAMYISYFFNSFIFLFLCLYFIAFLNISLSTTLISIGILAFLLIPFSFRLSRSIWFDMVRKKQN